ncbi:GNAT family N-acetyltransferase [Lichenifustis flavocetrariae]|uniref:N-acetyltransferase n=1 Tax=Lichenifustis flavocetrariae TaxID=2949735 RepID=A0AA41YUZ2_9HYPH|nr:N-acetyltransferase [Lichenifustis flavocetrariae]MCW6507552.1 N-acetyltransferase [Lichenifustis flavocetrariae]
MDASSRFGLSAHTPDWRRAFRLVTPTFRIRDERAADVSEREALLDAAFGPVRFTKTCERLREGRQASEGLSFVATAGSAIVGTIRLWDAEIGDRAALMLGPLAVDPALRSAGIGRALIEHALRRARKLGHKGVFLVGDAPYYARFGFEAALTKDFVLPGPVDRSRFLALELAPGGLQGAKGRVVGAGAFVDAGRDERGSRRAA